MSTDLLTAEGLDRLKAASGHTCRQSRLKSSDS